MSESERSSGPFSSASRKAVLVVSLIGHYERIAQYLFRDDGLRAYEAVEGPYPLRVKARSPGSLMHALWVMCCHLLLRPNPLIGIPRSNSRAIRLLTTLFPWARYFSYSDGLGDSIHHFYMEGRRNYVGHIGFPSLARQPLIHQIPLRECIEPWGELLRFDPDGPVLVIIKTPKETRFDPEHVGRLYARCIAAIGRHRKLLISGSMQGFEMPASVDGRNIGPLMKVREPIAISGAIGLPSTAFLTLVTRLPANHLRIMQLGCASSHPDADRRIKAMRQTLLHCMQLLAARDTREGGALTQPSERPVT